MRGTRKSERGTWNAARRAAFCDFCAFLRLSFLSLLVLAPLSAHAALSARSAVSTDEVFVGEAFTFQVQVSGSDTPQPPDLAGLSGFEVQEAGSQQNNSQSISMINGRVNRVVSHGYVFNYQLTARRSGRVTIPAFTIRAGTETTQTQPLALTVRTPQETDDVKLRIALSSDTCYVGEPLTLTFTWFLGQEVRNAAFTMPDLPADAFHVTDPRVDQQPDRQYYRIPIGGSEAVAVKGRGRLDGKEYATISFNKVLIPRKAGSFQLQPATVNSEVLVGYKDSRGRGPFDNGFFSDFFGGRQGVYKRLVVPSNPLRLEVKPLPTAGQPARFEGHVGTYHVDATATPTDVSVGDPITLTVTLSGPVYLDHVGLPALHSQPDLASGFKVPTEMAEGKTAGRVRVFTQTIRARRADITAVPPIELPYFDTEAGAYRIAQSDPIRLTVKASKVVTALDAEGLAPTGPVGAAVEAWTKGIAHNYEDLDVVRNRAFGPRACLTSPLWLGALFAPPAAYLVLLAVVLLARHRHADPAAARARRAAAIAAASLRDAARTPDAATHVLDAIREYLGARLRRPGGALTYADVAVPLAHRGVSPETLANLQSLFTACEAGRYGGSATDPAALPDTACALIRTLERTLR